MSSEFSIYKSDTSDNFNKKLNEYQEKLKDYQKQVGEIAIGQIVPDPKGIALDKLTHGVAGEISSIKTMADLGSIMLSISQDTVDLYKEASKGGTTQTRVAEVKQGICKAYNGMIIQTASDAILFNEIMTTPHGDDNLSFINTYKDIIRKVDSIPPKLIVFRDHQWKAYRYRYEDIREIVERFKNERFGRSSDITTNSYITDFSKDTLLVVTINYDKEEERYTVKGKKPPVIYFNIDPNYGLPAIYGFPMPNAAGYHSQYRREFLLFNARNIYYPDNYEYFTEDDIKSYYEEYGFEVPEKYKVVEISVTPQQLQSLQEIKSYAPKIPDYSTSDLYKYLNNLTDRWGIEAQILKEYPVSLDGKKALDEYKSDIEYLSNLAFYSRLFVIKGDHVLTVKPNEPVIRSLINLGDFKHHVSYFQDRIERNGQIAKEEYTKPFKNRATTWNVKLKELEDESKLAKSKLQKGKPGILGMVFGDESYDAATAKFNEAQRRINEAKEDIKEIEKSLQSNEIQLEKVNTVEALLNSAEKDLNEVDTYLKKSGEASALYKIARSYTRYIKRIRIYSLY